MARKSRRSELTFELTPLIDVVFLLLIFFMVSSVFKKDELALLLKLPKTQKGQSQTKVLENITIELSGDEIAFNGKKTSLEELEVQLEAATKETIVNLRADGDVLYQRLVKVLDVLQKKKIDNISLITNKENQK